jgi:hypothetical protein
VADSAELPKCIATSIPLSSTTSRLFLLGKRIGVVIHPATPASALVIIECTGVGQVITDAIQGIAPWDTTSSCPREVWS